MSNEFHETFFYIFSSERNDKYITAVIVTYLGDASA